MEGRSLGLKTFITLSVMVVCIGVLWTLETSQPSPSTPGTPPFSLLSPLPFSDGTSLTAVPNCPCHLSEVKSDSEWQAITHRLKPSCPEATCFSFHPGATWEVRFVKDEPFYASGQQCTFDQGGQLITGELAAGTPDRWGYDEREWVDIVGHTTFDVVPYLPGWWQYQQGNHNNYALNWYLAHWSPSPGEELSGAECAACNSLIDGLCAESDSILPLLAPEEATVIPWEVGVVYAVYSVFLVCSIILPLRLGIQGWRVGKRIWLRRQL